MRVSLSVFASLLLTGTLSHAAEAEKSADIACCDEEVTFDLAAVGHRFDGFGTQVWAFNHNPDIDLASKLKALNIRYVRLTRQGSWEHMRALRELTDSLDIGWVYTAWSAPREYSDTRGVLVDVPGFTRWWANEVDALSRRGMKPELIELMNEPDSMGHWSTGLSPETYNTTVKAVRRSLDARGHSDVAIVGPGLAHLDWERHSAQWIDALDPEAVAAIGAWSTHSWDDGDLCRGGASCIERQWTTFSDATRAKDAGKPVFVTELGSKETTYGGENYPSAAATEWRQRADGRRHYYSVTDTAGYAVRLVESSLALLNRGANVPFVWQLADEVSELNELSKSWGLVDIEGRAKPAFLAMTALAPHIPVGARVVRAPDQSANDLYGAAFVHDDDVVIAVTNEADQARTSLIRLGKVSGELRVTTAIAFETERRGSRANAEPDRGRIVERELDPVVRDGAGGAALAVRLPASSTLTVILKRFDAT